MMMLRTLCWCYRSKCRQRVLVNIFLMMITNIDTTNSTDNNIIVQGRHSCDAMAITFAKDN